MITVSGDLTAMTAGAGRDLKTVRDAPASGAPVYS